MKRSFGAYFTSLSIYLPTKKSQALNLSLVGLVLLNFGKPLAEADFYWHLIVGRDIVSQFAFDGNSLPTWSSFDPHWITTQSGSEVLMYLLYSSFGEFGISLARLSLWLLLAAYFLSLFHLQINIYKKPSERFMSWVALLTSLILSVGFTQERPASISIAFSVVIGAFLVRLSSNRDVEVSKFILLIFLLWPWFHPGWILAYLIVALCLVLKITFYGLKWKGSTLDKLIFILIPILVFITPAEFQYYKRIAMISRQGRKWISEWQPIWDITSNIPLLILIVANVASIVFLICKKVNGDLNTYLLEILLIIVILLAMVFAIRNTIYFLIFGSSILCTNSENIGMRKSTYKQIQFRKLNEIPKSILAMSLIPMTFFLSSVAVSAIGISGSENAKEIPKAGELISSVSKSIRVPINVINSPNNGGEIHFFSNSMMIPVADGRVDRYSDKLQKSLDRFLNASPGWRDTYRRDFSSACGILANKDMKIRKELESLGFSLIEKRGSVSWYQRDC